MLLLIKRSTLAGKIKLINLNRSAKTVFQYIFVLCLILNMRSIWLHTPSLPWMNRLVALVMGVSVALGCFVQRSLSKKRFKWCLFTMFLTVLYMGLFYALDPLKKNQLISVLLQLLALTAYCLLVENSMEDTIRKYTNVVVGIAAASLFFWIFGSLLGFLRPTGYLYTSWTDGDFLHKAPSYFGIYFETQGGNFFGFLVGMVRNTAIFTEAPMCSFVFTTALSAEILLNKEPEKLRCVILIAAVISTLSTSGYTAMVLILGLKYILTKPKSIFGKVYKSVTLPAVAILGVVVFILLVEDKLNSLSGIIRIDDFAAGFKAWLDAPIFGNGYENISSIQQYMSAFRRYNLGFSNSPMAVLAEGGIYLFMPYLTAVLHGITGLIQKRRWAQCSFYLVFLYSFIITVIPYQMLTFYLFICMFREGRHQPVKGVRDE